MLASSSRAALRRAVCTKSPSWTICQDAASGSRTMATGPAQSRNSFAPRQDNRPRREQRDPSRTGGNYGNNSGSARGAQGRMASQQRLRDITFQYQPDLEFRSGQIGTSLQRRNMELGRHAAASRLQAVVRLCADMKADGVTPDVTTYHYLLRVLAEHGMHKECLATLEDMEAIGITPDLQAYHYTMQSAMGLEMQHVWNILDIMANREIKPTEQTYEILILRHCTSSNLEHALRTMADLGEKGLSLTLAAAQGVISLACELGHPRIAYELAEAFSATSYRKLENADWYRILAASAEDLWAEGTARTWQKLVNELGVSPDEGTCILVLHTAARHGLVVLANEAIMRLQEAGITWQEHHVAPLVEAFARAGRVKEAFGALDLMLAAGVQPSPETTIPILDHIRDNSDKIDEAWGILEDIHEEGLAAASKPAEGATPVAAKTIHITSINVIIHAAAMMGDLQRAVGVYKAATSLGAVPDINTYDHLLLACVPGANRELADQLLSELRAARITPSQRTYEALMQVCLYQYSYEDAFFYLEEMKAQGHAPRPGVYEQLVMRLIKRGDARWKLALDEMKECGYTLSVEFQRRMDAARAAPGEDVSVAADEDGQQAIESSAKAFVEDMMMSGRKTSS